MPINRDVRLADVAAVAGVSLATASKALSGNDRVSEATRARVRAAADRLDFRPNALAQSFASGRSRTIGVLTHRAAATFSRPVVMGAVLEFGERGQAVLVLDGEIQAHREMSNSIRTLRDRRVDGLLVVGDGHEHVSPSLTHHFDVPVTYVFTAPDSPEDSVYLPDNEQAGYLATRHLIDTGRTRILHLTADATSLAVQRRERGMRRALSEAGLPLAGAVRYGAWSREWGAAAMEAVLDERIDFDAVFCGNDHIGFGAIDVCEARGVGVPGDVAVVGVDNWEGIVYDQDVRRLTTIDLELMRLGRLAAADVIGADRRSGERFQPPTLVLGPSS